LAAVPSVGRAAQLDRPAAATVDATRSLYERFAGQIYGYCLHQLGSREEAEDAVQTTFLNAFRGLKRGVVPDLESAWLFKIAHNVCLSRRRSSWRRGRVESPNNLEVLQEVVPAHERGNDDLIRLQDALEGMPETQRRAILLREWQGLSYREIAAALEVSQSAVETLIFRARRSLAARLEKEPTPERSWGRRTRYSVDAGGLAAAAKALLGGGTAIKAAATIAAVATTAVAVSDGQHALRRHPAKPVPVAPVRVERDASLLAPVQRAATRVPAHVTPAPWRDASHAAPVRVRPGGPHVSIAPSSSTFSITAAPPVGHLEHPAHPAHPARPEVAATAPPPAIAPPTTPPTAKPEHGKAHAKTHPAPATQQPQPQPEPPVAVSEPGDGAAPNGPPEKPENPGKGNGNGHK
jgi:RNA polymerase sigma factor (sigma-70 family)